MKRNFSPERLQLLLAGFAFVAAVLVLRLFQMQILEKKAYELAANRNRTEMVYQTAPRGIIYDRNGIPLATNEPVFSLIYLPPSGETNQKELNRLAAELSQVLRQDPGIILAKLRQARQSRESSRIAENLSIPVMFRLSELKPFYPGIDLVLEARRYYPFGPFASHLIGYMGKITPGQWARLKNENYRMDSRIGRLGLESIFERQLRGTDGAVKIEVDAQGRIQKILKQLPWKDGRNIHLTLDAIVQRAADEGLRHTATQRGAVIALDPSNGDILAFAAAPSFDPNELLGADPFSVDYSTFVPSSVPEFDRAISGLYAPGSTFKTIVSVAGINEGKLNPAQIVFCPGYFKLGRRTFLCWNHRGHGNVDFLTAFAQSCDVYFYKMGLAIGASLIEKYSKLFHLGQKTGIALKGEEAGNLFGPETSMKKGKPWIGGDTLNLAIGQGQLLVTPLQMAVVTEALANHGTLWRPQYLSSIDSKDGSEILKENPHQLGFVRASNKTWNLLDQAMSLVVASGTARGAYIKGIQVWGKTGTAQNSSGRDHAWFIAFAGKPGQAPSIAVSVLVENGGHGASAAVPIARQVIAADFRVGKKSQYEWHKFSPKKIGSSRKGETL